MYAVCRSLGSVRSYVIHRTIIAPVLKCSLMRANLKHLADRSYIYVETSCNTVLGGVWLISLRVTHTSLIDGAFAALHLNAKYAYISL